MHFYKTQTHKRTLLECFS